MGEQLFRRVTAWLSVRWSLERSGYGVALILCVAVGYAALQQQTRTDRLREKVNRFEQLVLKYRKLSRTSDQPRLLSLSKKPLAYLEEVLSREGLRQQHLQELTPSGTDEGGNRSYRIRLVSVPIQRGLSVLRSLESDRRVLVGEFTLERTSLRANRFDVRFRIEVPDASS